MNSYCVIPVVIFAFIIGVVVGEQCKKRSSCSCECSQGIIDLKELGEKNGPKYKDTPAPDSYKYSYNPCHPFTETDPQAFADYCHDVAACQIIENAGTIQYYDTGRQDAVTFYTVPGTDMGIVDMPGDVVVAKYTSGDSARQTEVVLVCNSEDTRTAFDTFGEIPNATPLYRNILVSPLACFVPANGLSGGSILLIIVFSLMFAYLIIGVLVNKIAIKQSGKELIPHVGFWTSLPGLVKDGFRFVVSGGKSKPYANV